MMVVAGGTEWIFIVFLGMGGHVLKLYFYI